MDPYRVPEKINEVDWLSSPTCKGYMKNFRGPAVDPAPCMGCINHQTWAAPGWLRESRGSVDVAAVRRVS